MNKPQPDDKDRLLIKSLINPDLGKEHYYDWPLEAQQRMLGCLLADKAFLDQCFHLVKPYYFNDKAHQKICKILYEYYSQYKKMPDQLLLHMELAEELQDNPARDYFLAELEIVIDCVEAGLFQRDYYLARIAEFAKTQALRVAFAKSIDILSKNEEGKWEQVEEVIQEALTIKPNVDLGLNYFEDLELRYKRMLKAQEDKDFFATGFPSVDIMLGGGLSRGEIGSFCALSGAGKSICMAGAAAENLAKGRKVLYVSLEMDEDKTAARFDSMLSYVPIQLLLQEHEDVIKRLYDFSKTLPAKDVFYIKQFAAGVADVNTVRAYMSQLSLQRSFNPDLVIVDYVGEMKDDRNSKTYESRQRAVRDLRGLAVEHKICILTGMQINRGGREAMKSGYIDDSFLADSQGQIRPLDALWSLNQEDAEAEMGVGRLFVVKHRNGKSRQMVHFRRDPNTLRTTEITAENYRKTMSEYAKKNSLNVDMNDIATQATRLSSSRNIETDE